MRGSRSEVASKAGDDSSVEREYEAGERKGL